MLKTKQIFLTLSVTFLSAAIFAFTGASSADAAQPSFSLPPHAREVSPNVYYLGKSIDIPSRSVVDGYAIVYKHREHPAKPDHAGGPKNNGGSTDPVCYGFLANGAYWKTNEPWLLNPTNSDGLNDSTLFNVFNASVTKWEDAAQYNILGNGTLTYDQLEADTVQTDGKNEIMFGTVDNSNTIGVTIVWGVFGGNPNNRRLVEWDQIYNEVDYTWSLTGEANKMDWGNITTHELGHSVGLADLYTASCADETMYGYASEGDTNKRDLNAGDIAGVNALY